MPEVIFNGPEGRLEGRYQIVKTTNAPIALLLHPHPEHGGTMNNKIVYALYQASRAAASRPCASTSAASGRSQGSFDRGEGELSDAAAALDWLQANNPNASACWVGGFSFGAWIGMQLLMRRPEIDGFISIAPPANMYDFSFLAPCPSSGLVVHGNQDDVVPPDSVSKLVTKLSHQRDINVDHRVVPGANHYFHGRMAELVGHVDSYLDAALKPTEAAIAE